MRAQMPSHPASRAAAPGTFKPWVLLILVIVLAAFTGCTNFYGRGIQYQIEHRYAVSDPQFESVPGSTRFTILLPVREGVMAL